MTLKPAKTLIPQITSKQSMSRLNSLNLVSNCTATPDVVVVLIAFGRLRNSCLVTFSLVFSGLTSTPIPVIKTGFHEVLKQSFDFPICLDHSMKPCLDSDYLFRFILQIAMCMRVNLPDDNKENPSTELGKRKAAKEEKDNHDVPCRFITVKLSFTCHPFMSCLFSLRSSSSLF